MITTQPELIALCQRMSQHAYITVDTEFHRETSFWPKLCLIQIASEDEAAVIDPLSPEINLAPLFALLNNIHVLKVFHAARQDLEIFWKLSGSIPTPLFDTQIAAMVCGFGEQIGYADLVQALTKARIDKSSRFSDWQRRPLKPTQIAYALGDVTHLRDVYKILSAQLAASKRQDWLTEELNVLIAPQTYEQPPERAYERLSPRMRKPRDLAILIELCTWREILAQQQDVPRNRILKDDLLIEIAQAAPTSPEALSTIRLLPKTLPQKDILAAIARGLARDPQTLPALSRRSHSASATVELLKVLLRHVSTQSGVAERLIATPEDLEAIAQGQNTLHGWRHTLFGAQATALQQGRLALTLEQGKITIFEWIEPQNPQGATI